MSKRQFFKAYLSALYAGDAATLRRLSQEQPQRWKGLNVEAVSKILDDRALSPADQSEAFQLEARKLHSQKVFNACLFCGFLSAVGLILALDIYDPSRNVNALWVLGLNFAIAASYFINANRAQSNPQYYGRLAFTISLVLWLYNLIFVDRAIGGFIQFLCLLSTLEYEEPRQRKTPSQTPPQRPTKKRRKKFDAAPASRRRFQPFSLDA